MAQAKKKETSLADEIGEETPQPQDSNDETTNTVDAGDASAVEATDDEATGAAKKVTKAGRNSRKAVEEAETEAARKEAAASKADDKPKPKAQKVNPLKRHGKNYRKVAELIDKTKQYDLAEAIELAKQTVTVKFVPSLELHLNLGVDPRQADQMVRANVVLPAGTGKSLRVAVLAPAAKHAEAKQAGANIVGEDDLIDSIEKGTIDFDKLIATPDLMPKLAKLAKVLGPKGLMPNPKSGSVTADVAKAVAEAKAGKVEFRIDKQAIVHQAFGKADFANDDLLNNVKALIDAVIKAKPSAAKGTYVKAMAMTTTMGPGIKINVTKAIAEANPKK